MDNNNSQTNDIIKRILWLILARVVIVTFLLGAAAVIDVRLGGQVEAQEVTRTIFMLPAYLVIMLLISYLLSVIYLLLAKINKNLQSNIYFQGLCDVAAVTGLVYATGGIDSVYYVFYSLIIIYCVLFLGRYGGLIIASAASIAYGLLLNMEFYQFITPLTSSLLQEVNYSAGYVLTRIFVHIISFYIITLIASYVVEREKKVSSLLAEKENAFEQLDLLHRSIVESVEAGILTIDLQGRIKSFNRAAEEITGYALRDVVNKKIDRLFTSYLDLRSGINQQTRERRFIRKEVEFTCKNNERIILGLSLSPLKSIRKVKVGEILIFQDLTAHKKMEDDLEKSRRLAFIGEMAAGLAHEIRNPLAAMSGSIQLLRRSILLNKTDERLMEIVIRGKEQIESFMQDFLLLARPSPGPYDEIDITEIISEVLESLRLTPDWHDLIAITTILSPGISMKAKKTDIRQVIWNLVMNAVQAMPEGGQLAIETKVEIDDKKRVYWLLKIADTGCGIEDEDLPRVMEPLFTRKEKGTGLGLTIVNKIVTWYGGTVTIESKRLKGTKLLIRFPYGDHMELRWREY